MKTQPPREQITEAEIGLLSGQPEMTKSKKEGGSADSLPAPQLLGKIRTVFAICHEAWCENYEAVRFDG